MINEMGLFFIGDRIIVSNNNLNPLLPFQVTQDELNLNILTLHNDNNITIVSCEIASSVEQPHTDYQIMLVKRFLAEADSAQQSLVLRAYHWLNWYNQAKFCGHCGAALEGKIDSTEKKCAACNTSLFPRFSPAVMVLIRKENKILMARSPHFPPGLYSAIAGFIDIGETAEAAAHREVKEELGIEITDLEYFGTQSWPFPDSFMIAFKAKYLKGELQPDPNEIEDAGWYSLAEIPTMPPSASIARKLIESAVADILNDSKTGDTL